MLVKAYPNAAKEQDGGRMLPLHRALMWRASDTVIEMLFKAHPDAVKEKDGDGMLPLHLALEKASDTVIEMLFAPHPDAAKDKGGGGMLPPHRVLKHQASDTVIEMLFKAHPDAVKEKGGDGMLPLHLALKHQASDTVIEMLLTAHPDAVKEKDGHGMLPLHYGMLPLHRAFKIWKGLPRDVACECQASIIEMLVKAYPNAAKEQDGGRMLPLHRALMWRASDTVIEMLFKAHPGAAKQKGEYGWLPLHSALRSQASETVIEMLFKAHPNAAKEKDVDGMLPLHRASRDRASDAVIQMLSGLASLSTSDIASFVHDVSPGHASHGKLPRLFPILIAGATTLGSFESTTSALMAMSWVRPHSLEEGLRLFRVWHRGGKLWKMCIERTFGQLLPSLASHTIANFVCGGCACEFCCRPRTVAEAAPGGDK
eukprot:NODE_9228_length_1438_cov_5.930587.p1 GENE.NODE_9228_length_1438_cov_5.930587~~NODE_9228_length_1438_cov_5.930587.p1  ORF type:complete len:427 (+),score=55.06 NODE_9228_length_1438_cov_5.930587:1-1281(+)